MRPDIVVVGGIGLEDLTQVALAKDHNAIQAFPTDRANQPLRMPTNLYFTQEVNR